MGQTGRDDGPRLHDAGLPRLLGAHRPRGALGLCRRWSLPLDRHYATLSLAVTKTVLMVAGALAVVAALCDLFVPPPGNLIRIPGLQLSETRMLTVQMK